MNNNILVTYASKHGSTAEIGEFITAVLQRAGLNATALPVEQVTRVDQFTAVVLGSALYAGRWQRKAVTFLQRFDALLTRRPVWLFASGPTGEGDAVELLKGVIYPDSLKPIITQIAPQDVALFHGKLDVEELNFFERWVIQRVKAPTGDFRDWDQIEEWATNVAKQMKVLLKLPVVSS